MCSGRSPSPEVVVVATISPMIFRADGSTEGCHKKKQTESKKKGRRQRQKANNKPKANNPMSSWWVKNDITDTKKTEIKADHGGATAQ